MHGFKCFLGNFNAEDSSKLSKVHWTKSFHQKQLNNRKYSCPLLKSIYQKQLTSILNKV